MTNNINGRNLRKLLSKLAVEENARETANLNLVARLEELIPPNIKAQMDALKKEAESHIKQISADCDSLRADIVAACLKLEHTETGDPFQGQAYQAVYNHGRGFWNDDSLIGYSAAHPEVLAFRKQGAPSVSIRKVAVKKEKES